jgi:prophage regulatory protein
MRILNRRTLKDDKGVTYSNPHLLRLEREGKFPRRIALGDNRVGWIEEEIDAWIRARMTARDAAA